MPCPVCDEPLTDAPPQCFRCETQLETWWAFEASLAGEGPVAAVVGPTPPARWRAITSATLVMGVLAGVAGTMVVRRAPVVSAAAAPSEPRPLPSFAIASALPPPRVAPGSVAYRAQRGDSLWRVAAAVTGDGRRWRELWPDRRDSHLRANEVLLLPARSETR